MLTCTSTSITIRHRLSRRAAERPRWQRSRRRASRSGCAQSGRCRTAAPRASRVRALCSRGCARAPRRRSRRPPHCSPAGCGKRCAAAHNSRDRVVARVAGDADSAEPSGKPRAAQQRMQYANASRQSYSQIYTVL